MVKGSARDEKVQSKKVWSHSLKNITLYCGNIQIPLPEGSKIFSIPFCQIQDIKDYSHIQEQVIPIYLDFDLLVICEYMIDSTRDYMFFTKKLYKDFSIARKICGFQYGGLKHKNIIDNITCNINFDAKGSAVSLKISGNIECILLDEPSESGPFTGPRSDLKDSRVKRNSCQIIHHQSPKNTDTTIHDFKTELALIQNKYEQLRADYYKLNNEMKNKDSIINQLLKRNEETSRLSKGELTRIYGQFENILAEIQDLKTSIELENKNKLNYKVQSLINNVKTFF